MPEASGKTEWDHLLPMIADVEAAVPAANAELDRLVASLRHLRSSPEFPHPHIGIAMHQLGHILPKDKEEVATMLTTALVRLADIEEGRRA